MKEKSGAMLRILCSAALGAVVCLLGPSAYADTTWTGATDSEFGTISNWDNGSPGNPETVAIIGSGATVSNTVNHTGTNAYQLTVSGASTLNSSADFTTTYLKISGGSTLNLTGGSVTVPVQTANNNSTKIELNDGSLLNISGGVHTLNERIATYGTKSTIRINGSEATVNVHQQSTFTATIEFVFDADGVSTFDSDSRLGLGGSDLTVDARSYAGPSRTFDLVDVDWLDASSGFGGTIDITPPSGYTYAYNQADIQTTGEINLTLVESGKSLIFYDDFRENGLSANGVSRDGGWAGGADWTWSSGQMVSTGATARGMGRVVPVPSGLTVEEKLEFRLEYSASTNSSLRVHLWGLKDVSSVPDSWVMNLGGTVGMWYSAGGAFERCHLGNGSTNFTGYVSGAAVQIPSNVGTGLTYSCELDVGGFEGGFNQLSNYDYIAIGFQKGNGAATVSLDEVGLCALEPGGTVLWVR